MMGRPVLMGPALALMIAIAGCGYINRSEPGRIPDYTETVAAATSGDIPAVRAALDHDPKLIAKTEWDGATLLHDAVGHNEARMVEFLLSRGASVNAVTSGGLTPLHMAAQNGNVPIVALLLRHGANIGAIDLKGWTPLDRALKWHHPEAAAFLRAHGAKTGPGGAPASSLLPAQERAPAPPQAPAAAAHGAGH